MAEFCSCGSIIVNGHCTNKNCSIKLKAKPQASKSMAGKISGNPVKKEVRSKRIRRASKCITYNLNDIKKEEDTL